MLITLKYLINNYYYLIKKFFYNDITYRLNNLNFVIILLKFYAFLLRYYIIFKSINIKRIRLGKMKATFNVLFLIKSELELVILIVLTIRNIRKNRIMYFFFKWFFLFIIRCSNNYYFACVNNINIVNITISSCN